uniref:BSD domain-containing protein n=1 Tax=Leptocylindrus danicus TaxID=163516 RepID=A0A7S2P3E9_9STRA|mmetsp:Transcript_21646/g.32311  ORF Transcript_21646/g.32311 Transcript_21646/m.32311 type:complete len:229 (+) Transcript_21646:120-806(+)|eukprot:CAMPEP_0116026504 /NCGR_PEP_ID=MMETSP0321-20121206/13905_1 /TAXON_ID=163516 /ORGANISM="Leptocylindrus danicus var. danicus, Strain B650" /LENGTH=228 /DNA_ID=CAMNT_0003499345 /DNA_START=106 /DNA_END=792 /DNA_ORIENTATION=+
MMKANTNTPPKAAVPSFYKLTHSIVSSAANFMEELLDQFEVPPDADEAADIIDVHDNTPSSNSIPKKHMLLPWEVIERNNSSGSKCHNNVLVQVVSYPDLQRQILDISIQKMCGVAAAGEIMSEYQEKVLLLNKNNTVNFRNHVPMLQRMMQVDRNLAKSHSKLCTRRIQEEVFWNYYLMCVMECQREFFLHSKKQDKVLVGELEEEDLEEEKVSMHGTKMYEDFVVV